MDEEDRAGAIVFVLWIALLTGCGLSSCRSLDSIADSLATMVETGSSPVVNP